MTALPRLTYADMRTLAVFAMLRKGLQRWGIWVLMALGLLAAVGNTPEVALAGVGSLLAPLWWASGQDGFWGHWQWASVSLGYALLGMAWLRAWRPVLWPAHWRDTEATLPLRVWLRHWAPACWSASGALLAGDAPLRPPGEGPATLASSPSLGGALTLGGRWCWHPCGEAKRRRAVGV
ncbi:MAG: hypothetical protein C4K60_09605 [Ideonella sp. MAG2]|nr:MAG: hypothetical protein C4K60_09605 [Ideonella sp. MAG2]